MAALILCLRISNDRIVVHVLFILGDFPSRFDAPIDLSICFIGFIIIICFANVFVKWISLLPYIYQYAGVLIWNLCFGRRRRASSTLHKSTGLKARAASRLCEGTRSWTTHKPTCSKTNIMKTTS